MVGCAGFLNQSILGSKWKRRLNMELDNSFPGFTRLANGNWVANRTVYYPFLSRKRLEVILRRPEPLPIDIESLKDYKWMLLFDHQAAHEKGFMRRYTADGGEVMLPINKFWLVNIDERIRELGGDPQDLTNNPLVLDELQQPS
jgi:hypothetical protein